MQLKDFIFHILFLQMFSLMIAVECFGQYNGTKQSSARYYLNFAKLPYCKEIHLTSDNCKICSKINYMGFEVLSMNYNNISENIGFNMVLSYNEKKNELVISFSGPKSNEFDFFQNIYQNGFIKLNFLENIEVEKYTWNIYDNYFRQYLFDAIGELINNTDIELNYTIVGHSFGGTLATLSAFDLLITKEIHSSQIKVFTYGALKIGKANFIKKMRKLYFLNIFRIRRRMDFYGLIPKCIFNAHENIFMCFKSKTVLVRHFPKMIKYYKSYRNFSKTHIHPLRRFKNNPQSKGMKKYFYTSQLTVRSFKNIGKKYMNKIKESGKVIPFSRSSKRIKKIKHDPRKFEYHGNFGSNYLSPTNYARKVFSSNNNFFSHYIKNKNTILNSPNNYNYNIFSTPHRPSKQQQSFYPGYSKAKPSQSFFSPSKMPKQTKMFQESLPHNKQSTHQNHGYATYPINKYKSYNSYLNSYKNTPSYYTKQKMPKQSMSTVSLPRKNTYKTRKHKNFLFLELIKAKDHFWGVLLNTCEQKGDILFCSPDSSVHSTFYNQNIENCE
jgi:hypothetical protein